MPPCPLVIALVPFKCSSRNLKFHHRVPFTTGENICLGALALLKHTGLYRGGRFLIFFTNFQAYEGEEKNHGAELDPDQEPNNVLRVQRCLGKFSI